MSKQKRSRKIMLNAAGIMLILFVVFCYGKVSEAAYSFFSVEKQPVAAAITYGQPLSGSVLSGGTVKNGYTNTINACDFYWCLPGTYPSAGTHVYEVYPVVNETVKCSVSVTVQPKNIGQCRIVMENMEGGTYEYTGSPIEPEVSVFDGEKELEAGIDYTVTYLNNINVGDAGVIIAGKGNYGGSVTRYFVVVGADLETEVSSEDFSGEYDGKPHTGSVSAPAGSVIYYGTAEGAYNLITPPSYTDSGNYTVYYCVQKTNYQSVYGSFQVEISGKSNLEAECLIEDTEAVYDGNPHSIEVMIPKGAVIRYRTKRTGNYDLSVKPSFMAAGTHTIYFCVSLKNFEDYEGEATVSIGETDLEKCSISLKNQKFTYTGNPIEPEVIIVNANKSALVRGLDYELEFYDNVDAGTASITVTGKGNYSGYVSVSFEIMQKVVENVEVPIISTIYTYGVSLSEIGLPANYEWGNDMEIPHAGTDKYQVVYTPEDVNYGSVIVWVYVTVNKANPDVSAPDLESIQYSEKTTLKDIAFPEDEEGAWEWAEPDTIPVVNNKGYAAVFKPKDAINYNERRIMVPLDVEKGIPQFSVPDGINGIYDPERTLKEYPLPAGFSWDMPDEVPTVGNDGYEATYTPLDGNYETVSDIVIPVKILKATPEAQQPNVLTKDVVYSPEQTLEEIELTEGWRWLEEDTVPTVKNNGYPVVFVAEDEENYENVYEVIKLSVAKAEPETEVPDINETYTYSKFHTLQSIALPAGWNWRMPETVPEVNNNGYDAVYVPEDEENYKCLEGKIAIDIEQGIAVCAKPVFENIPYIENMALGDISLPEEDEGKWVWEEPEQKILSKEDTYSISFIPEDSDNLLPFETEISVSVLAYDHTMVVPDNLSATYSPERVLGEVFLLDGWSWEKEEIVPTVGVHTYAAVYTPDNTELFQTVRKQLEVTIFPGKLICNEEPSSGRLPYGKTLESVEIIDGEMETEENQVINGVWKWESGELKATSLTSVLAYIVFVPDDSNYETSRFQVQVPVVKGSREAPDITVRHCSYQGSNDGMIEGVSKEMEYKLHRDTENKYKSCDGKQITRLEPGIYDVRYRNTEFYYASPSTTVTINDGNERYTVQYISEGKVFASYEIASGESLMIPTEIPNIPYKHFRGWFSGVTQAETGMKVVSNLTFQAEYTEYTDAEMEKAYADEFQDKYQKSIKESVTQENMEQMRQIVNEFMNLSDTAVSYLPEETIYHVRRIRKELNVLGEQAVETPIPTPIKPSETAGTGSTSNGVLDSMADMEQQKLVDSVEKKEGVFEGRPQILKRKAKKRSVTVNVSRQKGCRYVFQCSTNKKFTKKKQISSSSPAATFRKLKSKKRYYVRVRLYFFFNGKISYSKWSKTKSVKTK